MIASRRQDSVRKHTATSNAINEYLLAGTLVSISSIAEKAGVSRNFIYSHPELLHQLEAARKTQADSKTVPSQRQPTHGTPGHAALLTELALANQTIKRLRHNIAELQARHQHCLGGKLDRVEVEDPIGLRAAEDEQIVYLRKENRVLHQHIEELIHRIRDLEDDLTAERRAAIT